MKIMTTQLEMLTMIITNVTSILSLDAVSASAVKSAIGEGPDIVRVMTKMIMMSIPMTTTTDQEAKVQRALIDEMLLGSHCHCQA